MRYQKVLLGACLAAASASCASILLAQAAEKAISEEYLLLGNADRGAGEPIIFVNPKDSNNLIVVAMATLNRLPSGEAPVGRASPEFAAQRIRELSVPDGSLTDIAVTHDGGKTWVFTQDNLRKFYNKNRCSDSFSGAGPDGTLYMGCLAYLNRGSADYDTGNAPNGEARDYHGGSAIEWSRDKGVTWSAPVWVHPDHSPSLYAPTVKPVFEQASPWDRPYFVADASTGTIYVSGSGPTYTVDPATVPRPKVDPSLPGKGYTGYPPTNVTRNRTYIRASHDDGKTWGIIYPSDSDEYPVVGRGGFSASFGNLVVAYTAASVPAGVTAQCPCAVFGTSRDDGKTFSYHVIPPLPGSSAIPEDPRAAGRSAPMVAADPSKKGRYAVARQSGQQIYVTVTEDDGKTWLKPVLAAELPKGATFGHRAMKYSAKGALALIWKAVYEDKTFDTWSSASRDSGDTFKTIRVSHAISPAYIPDRGNFLLGDDLSSVDVDDHYVYVVWGDNRAGFQGTWFGMIPLSAY